MLLRERYKVLFTVSILLLWGVEGIWAQVISPPRPVAAQSYTTMSLSLAESFNSMQPSGNFLMMRLYLNTSTLENMGPFIFKGGGMVRLGGTYIDASNAHEAVRVTDNELFSEAALIYPVGWPVNPYVAANVRTSITETFSYSSIAKTRFAKFWDPVMSLEGFGLAYNASGGWGMLNTRLGLGLQQVRAEDHPALTDDPSTRGVVERYKAPPGIEHATDASLRLDSTIGCNLRLGMFSSFDDMSVWTVRFDGDMRFRFWRFLEFAWTLGIMHDIRVSRRTHVAHSITFGLTHEFR